MCGVSWFPQCIVGTAENGSPQVCGTVRARELYQGPFLAPVGSRSNKADEFPPQPVRPRASNSELGHGECCWGHAVEIDLNVGQVGEGKELAHLRNADLATVRSERDDLATKAS